MTVPISTYRLQITEALPLQSAAGLVDYLTALGADWVYTSPLLEATTGSDHGYDVVDHGRIDPARGGPEGLAALSAACRDAGRGLIIDIVPNHVGVSDPAQNAWWWDVLAKGRSSQYAKAFDIDWDFGGGRLRIPVLGGTLEEAAEAGELTVTDGELRYFDNRYPLAAGTADDDADAATVHSRQHYELINWRRADDELNYRRFFGVNSLAAIRVEVPWVFHETHREIVRWFEEGLADGLRVDHPDGLADPGGYLDTLAAATGNAYVLVEKILEGPEQLPAYWAAAGTTGYDALADIDRLLVDRAGAERFSEIDSGLRERADSPNSQPVDNQPVDNQPVDWETLIHGTKRRIADGILRSEVLRLDREFHDGRERQHPDLVADAIAELLACFPVYRSYLPVGVEHLEHAAARAREHRPELSEIIDSLLPVLSDPAEPMAIRFQQTSGMVMAKGVEDTAFYRYTRLASLTEVGADPSEFGIDLAEFHSRQLDRQARFPASMTTLSTHDTKRGEDTRARISVLSETPDLWEAALGELRDRAAANDAALDDGPLENLLWESIIGCWPASRERLHAYAEKAAREAGNSTNWLEPDEDFERRMHALVDSVFDDDHTAALIDRLVEATRDAGWSNSLSAKLIQLTAPGVPDVYQGSELWEHSLVDPDNRRPIDFDLRRLYLSAVESGAHPPIDESGAAKLLVVSRALRLRRDRPELFTRYAPLPAIGERAEHAVAFDRGGAITVATRLPVGLRQKGGWGDSSVMLKNRPTTEIITGREFDGGQIALAELLQRYPVALLVQEQS